MTKIERFWLFLLFFSFFYELPLIHLSFDRINPRLFDITVFLGVFIFVRRLFVPTNNSILKCWSVIVCWFVFCSIMSSLLFLPNEVIPFSLLASFRYIESLLLLKILLVAKIPRKIPFNAVLCGMILVGIYCIYQYYHPVTRELAPGVFATINVLTGPLSSSYFEIAQLLPLAAVFILSQIDYFCFRQRTKVIITTIVLACCWPLLFTGSRTGLLLFIVSLLVLGFFKKKKNYYLIFFIISASLYLVLSHRDFTDSDLYSISRAIQLEEGGDSVQGRLDVSRDFQFSDYDFDEYLPFIGAGFDVAPIAGYYRIDYGVHSMYLYPLEQSGIIGFLMFIFFLLYVGRTLWRHRKDDYSLGVFAYFFAMAVAGIGAHNFWREFSSGNVNTFILASFCLVLYYNKKQ